MDFSTPVRQVAFCCNLYLYGKRLKGHNLNAFYICSTIRIISPVVPWLLFVPVVPLIIVCSNNPWLLFVVFSGSVSFCPPSTQPEKITTKTIRKAAMIFVFLISYTSKVYLYISSFFPSYLLSSLICLWKDAFFWIYSLLKLQLHSQFMG